jgi:PilX N-terminal
MSGQTREAGKGQGGFALILALLTLLVLTFLGLTLAATTSTELQIATNYRWGQQALYNAEAGLEVAKVYLRAVPVDWQTVLPDPRPTAWPIGGGTRPLYPAGYPAPHPSRDFENYACDAFGGQTGYGIVLNGSSVTGGPAFLQDVTQVMTYNLNGAFTVWIRRPLTYAGDNIQDVTDNSVAIITAEGIAPALGMANAARRVVELRVQGASFDCESQAAMSGAGQGGAGFATCRHLNKGCGAAGSIEGAFGAAARSTGTASKFATGSVGSLCDSGKS